MENEKVNEAISIPPAVLDLFLELVATLLKRALTAPTLQASFGVGEMHAQHDLVNELTATMSKLQTMKGK